MVQVETEPAELRQRMARVNAALVKAGLGFYYALLSPVERAVLDGCADLGVLLRTGRPEVPLPDAVIQLAVETLVRARIAG